MKQYLISSVFSLSLISYAYADELSLEEQCLILGYDTKISDCEAAGSAALVCPVNNGSSDMAICITDSCRGYPLFKKSGKFYYHDQAGNEIETVPSKGQLTDYMEGDFETCTAGYGDNAVTYYRVPQCKGEALYNNYFCDVGCDTEKKYPYTYHPGNTAGIVQKCVTADQTYYGYSSCNKGWIGGWSSSSGVGRCGLDDCDMVDYPYPIDPKEYYGEDRGKTETCKIGGAVYYRYTECNGNDFVLKGSVCARKCEITYCSNTPLTGYIYANGEEVSPINDWSCNLSHNKCKEGDIVMTNKQEIGIIMSMSYSFSDGRVRKLLLPVSYTPFKLETIEPGVAQTQNIPQLKNQDIETWGKIQTSGVMTAQQQNGYSYPIAERCLQYTSDNCSMPFCKANEWYWPSLKEMSALQPAKYIISNTIGYREFPTQSYITSSKVTIAAFQEISNRSGKQISYGNGKNYFIPTLAF